MHNVSKYLILTATLVQVITFTAHCTCTVGRHSKLAKQTNRILPANKKQNISLKKCNKSTPIKQRSSAKTNNKITEHTSATGITVFQIRSEDIRAILTSHNKMSLLQFMFFIYTFLLRYFKCCHGSYLYSYEQKLS